MSQDDLVLAYLHQGHAITPAIAAEPPFRCLALHSAIARLRARGYMIECTIRSRGRTRWGEYTLVAATMPTEQMALA